MQTQFQCTMLRVHAQTFHRYAFPRFLSGTRRSLETRASSASPVSFLHHEFSPTQQHFLFVPMFVRDLVERAAPVLADSLTQDVPIVRSLGVPRRTLEEAMMGYADPVRENQNRGQPFLSFAVFDATVACSPAWDSPHGPPWADLPLVAAFISIGSDLTVGGAPQGYSAQCRGPGRDRLRVMDRMLQELDFVARGQLKNPDKTTTLRAVVSGVLREYRGCALHTTARMLIGRAALEYGYKSMLSRAASLGVQLSLHKLGSQVRAEVPYLSYRDVPRRIDEALSISGKRLPPSTEDLETLNKLNADVGVCGQFPFKDARALWCPPGDAKMQGTAPTEMLQIPALRLMELDLVDFVNRLPSTLDRVRLHRWQPPV
uniref:Uncharacterized protein n=1 Tax=Chromera velia CCMP2878 TaxID=1169474 RepID=A0A0G4GEY4_9ALVE|eukprot:Cvel_4614.t1-p1 / transcript=Cvel_4614.t1 / gene=Cvel_4614 / organism=Chromera_velia_CCMP2878 / gene_product=hypothetical protein / transcript_product=hypothetical protein / location=Cvel_scaffold203:11395-12510(+) / protein_length=372 / sequence_SO=supercontig / SO=protein_coding / is_pseudo=false